MVLLIFLDPSLETSVGISLILIFLLICYYRFVFEIHQKFLGELFQINRVRYSWIAMSTSVDDWHIWSSSHKYALDVVMGAEDDDGDRSSFAGWPLMIEPRNVPD